MNLNQRIVAAARSDAVLRDLTDRQTVLLLGRGHARFIRSTGRWVLTEAGVAVAREIEAELSASELAEIGGVA